MQRKCIDFDLNSFLTFLKEELFTCWGLYGNVCHIVIHADSCQLFCFLVLCVFFHCNHDDDHDDHYGNEDNQHGKVGSNPKDVPHVVGVVVVNLLPHVVVGLVVV